MIVLINRTHCTTNPYPVIAKIINELRATYLSWIQEKIRDSIEDVPPAEKQGILTAASKHCPDLCLRDQDVIVTKVQKGTIITIKAHSSNSNSTANANANSTTNATGCSTNTNTSSTIGTIGGREKGAQAGDRRLEATMGNRHLQLAETLFWRFLENLLLDEKRRFELRVSRSLQAAQTQTAPPTRVVIGANLEAARRAVVEPRFDCTVFIPYSLMKNIILFFNLLVFDSLRNHICELELILIASNNTWQIN